MRVLPLSMVVGGLVVVAVGAVWWWRRHRDPVPEPAPAQPRSLVRVLGDVDDLRAALERASRFERDVARALQARASRYEALMPTALVMEIRSDTTSPARSATPLTQQPPHTQIVGPDTERHSA